MGFKETKVDHEIELAINAEFAALGWRNHRGMGYQGRKLELPANLRPLYAPGTIIVEAARTVTFGGPDGSHDRFFVGPYGLFMSIDAKHGKGKAQPNQLAWSRAVRMRGGIACIAHSAEEAVRECRSQIEEFEEEVRSGRLLERRLRGVR